jgi:1-acyl-sn-glycerol-3-phosphate acyltransferase
VPALACGWMPTPSSCDKKMARLEITSLKCYFFLFFLSVGSALGWVTCVSLTLPLLLLSYAVPISSIHQKYRFITRFIAQSLGRLIIFFITSVYGTTITTSGDTLSNIDATTLRKQPVLLLCNHRTKVDLLFLLCLFNHSKLLSYLTIQLQSKLSSLPFLGWMCQFFQYMFVDLNDTTKWETADRTNILESMACQTGDAPTYLLFCEGTSLSPTTLQAANLYSATHNLMPRKYVLHPQTNSTELVLEQLRTAHPETLMVYDLTIAYKDHEHGVPTSAKSFTSGTMPNNVHVDVEKILLSNIPTTDDVDDQSFNTWLANRWDLKEKVLALHYEANEEKEQPFYNKQRVVSKRCFPKLNVLVNFILIVLFGIVYISRVRFFIWTVFLGIQLIINRCCGGVHLLERCIRSRRKKFL